MLPKFSVHKPYTVIVGVVLIIILGIVSFSKMTTDLLPSMELPYAIVMTTYEGASPETVETVVSKPIEQSLATVSNIKEVTSYSNENMSVVYLEFEGDADMDAAALDMREKLDMIKGYWPDKVGNPTIMKLNPNMMPVMVTALDSDRMDTTQLSKLVKEKISPGVESVDGVASVSTSGMLEENVHVIVSDKKIKKLNRRIKKALSGQFTEAQGKIDAAQSKLETGQKQLDRKRSQANATLAKAQTALTSGKMTLAQKEVQVTSAITNLKNQKTALDLALSVAQRTLKPLEAQYKTMASGAAKTALKNQIQQLQKQIKTIKKTRSTLNSNIKKLQSAQKQIQAGQKKLDTNLTKVTEGSASANAQMNAADIKIAQGQSELSAAQKQLDSSKQEAYTAADLKDKVTVENVTALLTAQNFEMPAGYITDKDIKYLVRVGDKVENQEDLRNMELMDLGIKNFGPICLNDVADVAVVNNKDDIYCRINGNDGVVLTVSKQTNYATADVSNSITEKLKQLTKENKGLHYNNIMDQGIYINMVVNSVLENLIFGAILAVAVLLLFLKDIRPTIVIACSIPISIIFAVVLMYFSGITLNVISLSGLALGVGMLVDNSIVVIENIYRLRKEQVPVREAAIAGTKGVAGAITASTLTTVSVFLPIVFTTGLTRQLFVDMGLTIGYSLLASLIVAVTFVPMMSAGVLHKVTEKDNKFFGRLQHLYRKIMQILLGKKIIVIVVTLAIFAASIFGATRIGSSLMPTMDSTQMSATIKMKTGTPLSDTAAMADTIMEKIREVKDVDSVGAMVSTGTTVSMSGASGDTTDEATVYILLKEDKTMNNAQIKKEIQKKTKKFDCELDVQESTMDMSALGGSGIAVEVKGTDLKKLRQTARKVAQKIQTVPGTKNVSDGMEETTPDVRVSVEKEKAVKYGLTVATVYQQLNAKLQEGSSATSFTQDETEWDVKISNSNGENVTRSQLKKMKLDGTVAGKTKQVKLSKIASFSESDSLSTITRKMQTRMINVTAEVKDGYNVGKVSSVVSTKLKSVGMPGGYSYTMAGELQSINETTGQIGLMLLLAVAFMYLIMVAQFQSLKSPFIILFTIPLAFTGGFLALLFTGNDLSIIAMIGFVMLAGIIVNNGIVLVDTTNQLLDQGYDLDEGIVTAGAMRVRPILMTAITTILGLSTMALGFGSGADMVRPMAIVTIGGLIYGTLLTLIFVPCIYGVFNRRRRRG